MDVRLGNPKEFDEKDIDVFLTLIKEQNKIGNPRKDRIMNCKYIAMGYVGNEAVCIGAIKQKTRSDFNSNKANLEHLQNQFEWEIGYFFTKPSYEGKGYSSSIMHKLLEIYGGGNLMATTEIREGNRMINSLENRQFKQIGEKWMNSNNDAYLRLFLRFE